MKKKHMKDYKQQLLAIAALIALIWAVTGFMAMGESRVMRADTVEGGVFSATTAGSVVGATTSSIELE